MEKMGFIMMKPQEKEIDQAVHECIALYNIKKNGKK